MFGFAKYEFRNINFCTFLLKFTTSRDTWIIDNSLDNNYIPTDKKIEYETLLNMLWIEDFYCNFYGAWARRVFIITNTINAVVEKCSGRKMPAIHCRIQYEEFCAIYNIGPERKRNHPFDPPETNRSIPMKTKVDQIILSKLLTINNSFFTWMKKLSSLRSFWRNNCNNVWMWFLLRQARCLSSRILELNWQEYISFYNHYFNIACRSPYE